MPVSGRVRTDCVFFAAHHCLEEAEFCVPAQYEVSCLLLLLLDGFSFRKQIWKKKRLLALLNCIILKDSRLRVLAVDQCTVEHAAHVLCSFGSDIHCPSPLFSSICQVTWSLYWLKVPRTLHSLAELSDCIQSNHVKIFKMLFLHLCYM